MGAIYVECTIRSDMERIWSLTQDPKLHERWDLRFTSIDYLPRESLDEPQRFRYRTNIGCGLPIEGAGESVGERSADGIRTSALKFWSDDWRSLIREGSGYWQYETVPEGTRFRTRYDYRVRYGWLGRIVDFVFRPILGRATAWSFDALRLWAERDIPPEISVLRVRIHAACRSALAIIWAYTGLVPKLLVPTSGEFELIQAGGIPKGLVPSVAVWAGIAELALAASLVLFWNTRWLLIAQAMLAVVLPIGLIAGIPDVFWRPFNPVTLGIAMLGLGICGFLASKDLPCAASCLRKPQ